MEVLKPSTKIPGFENSIFSKIEPLPSTTSRPFWSVMITVYNRTDYLEQAIKSILEQGFSQDEMQIEVVDDCSPKEDIKAIVDKVGQGRVSFYRQPHNVGIARNWNTCITRAHGKWIHILSDDDMVLPNFYEVYRHVIESYDCLAVLGQSVIINEMNQWIGISSPLQAHEGLLDSAKQVLAYVNSIKTPGIVVAREAYEKVGGFADKLSFTPDWEMWARLGAYVGVGYVDKPYSLFREHSNSLGRHLFLTSSFIPDTLAGAEIIRSRFSDPKERRALQAFMIGCLADACRLASHKLSEENFHLAALQQATLAIRFNPSYSSFENTIKLFLRFLKSLLKPR